MNGTLIKIFNVGDRVIKTYKSGTSKIGYKAETENPIPLDPATNWIVAEKDGDVQCCGPVSVDEIADMPDGSTVELFTDEELFYAKTQEKAVPWELGITAKGIISHGGKIYKVNQPHTVVDPNHTPDIVPALYTEIPQPGASGYPVWARPTGAQDAWAINSIVQWPDGGQLWRSTIPANTTEPGTLLPWNYWVKYEG